jgi:hypothetical protein
VRNKVVPYPKKNSCQHQRGDHIIQDHHKSPGFSWLGDFHEPTVWRSFRFHPVDLIGDNLSALHRFSENAGIIEQLYFKPQISQEYYFIFAYLLHFHLNYLCAMMRIALIILAIYTTALSCIPCKDTVSTRAYGTTLTVIKAGQTSQQAADIDLCTPFCTCTCCASVSIQQQVAALPEKTAFSLFEDIAFAYLSRTHSGDLTSIWQPPRA